MPSVARSSATRWTLSGGGIEAVTIHVEAGPLLALGAGIAILIVPRLLNYIVAFYLIAIGALGLVD